MYIYIIMFILLLLAIFSYQFVVKDVFSPPIVLCGCMFFSVLVAAINAYDWSLDLDVNTFYVLFVGVFSFIIAFATIYWIKNKKYKKTPQCACETLSFRRWSTEIYICGLVFTILYYYSFILTQGIGDTLATKLLFMRVSLGTGKIEMPVALENLFLFYRVSSLIYIYDMITLYVYKKKINVRELIIVILSILLCLMTGARGYAFYSITSIVILYLCVYMNRLGDTVHFNTKFLYQGSIAITFVLLLFFMSIFLMGRGTINDLDSDVVSYFFEYISMYLGAEIKGLDLFVSTVYSSLDDGLPVGIYTLNSTYAWLIKHFDLFGWTGPYVQDYFNQYYYAKGIMLGNVYTAYASQYQDGGLFGVFLYNVFYGMIMSFLYLKAMHIKEGQNKKGISWGVMAYSYIYYTIPLCFFAGFFYIIFSPGIWKEVFFFWIYQLIFLRKLSRCKGE